MRIVTLLVLSGLLIASTGCVSKGTHEREVNALQAQVSQMDTALRTQQEQNQKLQAELESTHARKPSSGSGSTSFAGALYRTPSGFQLPAVDIQKALKGAGYYSGGVDGKFGPDSREALRNFQKDNGLAADGVCGRQTWDKLKVHLA